MQNAMLLTDFYKVGHPFQYPKNTTMVYSNMTARKSRIPQVNSMVFFGLQYFLQEYLQDRFNREFFDLPQKTAIENYSRIVRAALGSDLPSYKHLEDLHDLGYLPVRIKALPEGSVVPIRVPMLTIVNTLPEFYWVTNFLETLMSATIWQPSTSATIANEYRKTLDYWANKTGMPPEFVQWQGHDFSFRGMSSLESAVLSGMGHLLSFSGTDTIPAIMALEDYYGADVTKELVGGSVPATEHSVMCAGGKEEEIETFNRLLQIYPAGILSAVSDTWNLWKVLEEILPALKDKIMARNGKLVIRPDSGNPVDIICGLDNKDGYEIFLTSFGQWRIRDYNTGISRPIKIAEKKGVIELLWDVFGGTINDRGYKVLDPHVGAIYGDSITHSVANDIAERLMQKGFASQCVLGIGSYTYQMNTRDTLGMAMKATYVEIEGQGREIFKDPVTDDGTKKSAKGLIRIDLVNGEYVMKDCVSKEEEKEGELRVVFENGELVNFQKLGEIRKRLYDYNKSKYSGERQVDVIPG